VGVSVHEARDAHRLALLCGKLVKEIERHERAIKRLWASEHVVISRVQRRATKKKAEAAAGTP
jgi:hypothetical protein